MKTIFLITIVTTISTFNFVESRADLFVSAATANSVMRFDSQTGEFKGNFVAPGLGGLNGPLDNLFLPNGDFLVSSYNNSQIKRYSSTGVYIDDPIQIAFPQGLQIGPDGHLYAGSFTNGVINRYDINTFAFLGVAASASSMTNNFVFHSAVPEPAVAVEMALSMIGGSLIRRRRRIPFAANS